MRFEKNVYQIKGVDQKFLDEASEKFDMTPKIMEQIILRGNDTFEKIEKFLFPSHDAFLNPFGLSGMNELIARLEKAKNQKENVLIFGDYDVDGISATAIMLKALKLFGINAKYFLPNRYNDGYGLTNDVLKKIKKIYNPSLIVTVDCGIACWQEVEFGKSIGIEIIVTDHHEIPEKLPNTIVLNAKLPNQKYGFSGLCGTGLAYKIASALLGKQAEQFLAIACVATIADIVPLQSENRALVQFGLKCLDTLPIGVKMLFQKLNIPLNKCTASDISFKVSPRINASGRMGDAQDSLKLYLSEDIEECKVLIEKILTHNDNRKDLCKIVETDCQNILSKVNLTAPSIILSSKDWDQGILGIICAKLVGQFNRPVFLFSEENGEMRGSARSIPGVNIFDLLSSMKELLENFGGHPLAAGLTIKTSNFGKFVNRVNSYLLKNYPQSVFVPVQKYDVEVTTQEITSKFLKDLQKLEPCGCENESLRFMLTTKKFAFTPMKNYYNHCNISIEWKLNLVAFDALKEYKKMTYADKISVIFELQAKSLRGNLKAINCEYDNIKNIGKMEVIPYLEQIRYTDCKQKPEYSVYKTSKKFFETDSCFGTAYVVNSETGFNRFMMLVDKDKVIKFDVCDGTENSGLNSLIMYPNKVEYAKFFDKIVFLDPIIDDSYIAKLNEVSKAKIFVPSMVAYKEYFESLNTSRENFGKIFNNLKNKKTKFNNFLDLYLKVKPEKNAKYNFKEFYSAMYTFLELKLIEINEINYQYELKINEQIKTELSNSLYYQRLTQKVEE